VSGTAVGVVWIRNHAALRPSGPCVTRMHGFEIEIGAFVIRSYGSVIAIGVSAIAIGLTAIAIGLSAIAIGLSAIGIGLFNIATGLGERALYSSGIAIGSIVSASGHVSAAPRRIERAS